MKLLCSIAFVMGMGCASVRATHEWSRTAAPGGTIHVRRFSPDGATTTLMTARDAVCLVESLAAPLAGVKAREIIVKGPVATITERLADGAVVERRLVRGWDGRVAQFHLMHESRDGARDGIHIDDDLPLDAEPIAARLGVSSSVALQSQSSSSPASSQVSPK